MKSRLFIVENCTIDDFERHFKQGMEKSTEPYIHPETYCDAWISFHWQPELWRCNELREYLGPFTLNAAWNNAVKHM